jgi:hypothetical protein
VTDQSDADMERARRWPIRSLVELRAGRADFVRLYNEYGDRDEEFHVTDFPLDRVEMLPDAYREILPDARTGQVIGPFVIGQEGMQKLAILRILRYDDSGEYSIDDPVFREQVRRRLEETRLQEEILRELRSRTYIDIRM